MKGAIFTPAEEVKAPAPTPAAPAKTVRKAKQRAREEDGQFKADNPTTPDVDEAWEQPKE